MAFALTRNKQLGLKIESTNGTKETLTASNYGLELTDIGAQVSVETIEKTTFRGSISGTPNRNGKVSASVELAGELKNSSVLNTAPKIEPVLISARMLPEAVKSLTLSAQSGTIKRGVTVITGTVSAATGLVVALEGTKLYYVPRSGTFSTEAITGVGGFTGTVSAVSATGTGFLYSPSSTPATEKTCTLKINDSGLLKEIYGSAATIKFDLSTSEYPKWSATYSGIADKSTWGTSAATVTGIAYEEHQPAVVVNAQIKIGSTYAPITSSVSLDIGNSVSLVENLNKDSWYEYALVTQRNASGSLAILADIAQSASLYAALFSGALAELTFTIGTGAGNQIDIICPQVQYTGISESDSNSLLAQTVNVKLTGDDKELLMWFR